MRRLSIAAACAALFAAQPALALDRIDFLTPGAADDLASALRASSLLLISQSDDQTNAQDLFAAAQAEYAQLLGTLYAAGHYSGVIHILIDGREAASIAPLDAPRRIDVIRVTVEPGPAFRFSRATVAPLARGTTLPDDFRTGGIARSGSIRSAAAAGVEGWRKRGHAKAGVAGQDITANHASALLSASIALDPGPRLRFGPLVIKGQERMRPERIRAIAGLPSGETFSPAELDLAATRLRRTGVFKSVSLAESDTITAPDLLPITATVVEEKTRRYSLGAEVASLDGVTLSGYWMHRNLLGGAERLKVYGEIGNLGAQSSGTDYNLGVTLDRPATFTADTTVGLRAEIGHVDDLDYSADLASVGLTATQIFSTELTARTGFSYDFSKGRDTVSAFEFRNVSLPLGFTWDRRDDATDATRGFFVDAEAKPFLGFGTTDSGVRFTWDARAYHSFATGRITLAARIQGGAIYGASLLGTPRDALFYSGGGGTVRGQPYQSLGVNVLRINNQTSRIGGSYFLGSQLEARLGVTKKIGIVGFYDYGQIGVDGFFTDQSRSHSGAGIGFRYDTGFGPIRLDIAKPVGGTTDGGVQIYVGLGQSF
nr:BamA/TamA family outer membrane protein [Gemmobacter straminiformis]